MASASRKASWKSGAKQPEPTKHKAEAKPEAAESDANKKITIYLRFSNVKPLNTFCEVELQVWREYACKCITSIELTDTLPMTITDLIKKRPKAVSVLVATIMNAST